MTTDTTETVFNIDELVPVYLDKAMAEAKRVEELMTAHGRKNSRATYRGIHVNRLYDWRALESRMHQLLTIKCALNDTYWNGMKQLLDSGRETGALAVWVIDPRDEDARRVMVYDDGGQSWRHADELYTTSINDPDNRAVVVTGDDARIITDLYDRIDVMRRRCQVYTTAFHVAVEERLTPFISNELKNRLSRYTYFNPGMFVIKNEDRTYIINSDQHGSLKWLEGRLFRSV